MQGDYNIGLICSNVILQTAQNKSDCSFCILFAVSSQLITMMYHRNVYTSLETQMISAAFAQTRLRPGSASARSSHPIYATRRSHVPLDLIFHSPKSKEDDGEI